MSASTNTAIIRKEYRETITFEATPTVETTRHLRSIGFDFDRRANVWYRKDGRGQSSTEASVVQEFK